MTRRKWLGTFTTKRNQLFIAWTPKQLARANRLGWYKRSGKLK